MDAQADRTDDLGAALDFSSEAFATHPWPIYAAFREREPVHRSSRDRCVYLFRHADVRATLQSSSFTVAHPFRGTRQLFGPTVIDLDGPDHRRLRGPLVGPLRASAVAGYIARFVEPAVAQLLEGLAGQERVDLITELAERLPARVGVAVLGMSPAHADDVYAAIRPIVRYLDDPVGHLEEAYQARELLEREIRGLIGRPPAGTARPSLLEAIAAAHLDGEPLADDAVVLNGVVLAVAVMETTTRALGNALACILPHPERVTALRADPSLIPAAVGESLRLQPPLHFIFRHAATDAVVAGVEIAKDTAVQLCLASANYDETVFEAPDRWRIDRERGAPLTFGWGAHGCLGALLARREIECALRALLARYSAIEVLEDPCIHGRYFRSPPRLLVHLRPDGASGRS